MKILQIRSAFEDNGPGTQTLTLSQELRRRGHEVAFAASGGALCDRISGAGFRILKIPGLARDKRDPMNFWRTVRAIRRTIRSDGFDVIHSHNAAATYCAHFASLGLARRPRLVRSVRGVEVRKSHQWRNLLYRTYPATMLAVSEFTRTELIRLGANPDNIVVTYNGVELSRFGRDRVSGLSVRQAFGIGDRLVVGHVGRFTGWKGQDILVEALARLKGTIPPTTILFVGDGPARERVETLVSRRGLQNDVVFAGFRTDVEFFHAAFDVYVQPSTRGEMLPNAILESMATSNPWIGSDISGLHELTAGGTAGIVCEPGSPDKLAEELGRLLTDPALRRWMGSAGRQAVEQHFTIQRVVDRVEAAYGVQGGS